MRTLILILAYQLSTGILLITTAKLLQPPVPVRIDRSMRVMRVGLWLVVLLGFLAALGDPFDGTLVLAGLPVFLLSTLLRVWAMSVMGEQFSYDLRVPDRLITVGPYRWLRHPAYLGSIGIFTSLGMVWGSWWATALIAWGMTGLFGWRAHVEERDFLSKLPTQAQ